MGIVTPRWNTQTHRSAARTREGFTYSTSECPTQMQSTRYPAPTGPP